MLQHYYEHILHTGICWLWSFLILLRGIAKDQDWRWHNGQNSTFMQYFQQFLCSATHMQYYANSTIDRQFNISNWSNVTDIISKKWYEMTEKTKSSFCHKSDMLHYSMMQSNVTTELQILLGKFTMKQSAKL